MDDSSSEPEELELEGDESGANEEKLGGLFMMEIVRRRGMRLAEGCEGCEGTTGVAGRTAAMVNVD
jgi:hypothetical protein